jgi:hypothetical protein
MMPGMNGYDVCNKVKHELALGIFTLDTFNICYEA